MLDFNLACHHMTVFSFLWLYLRDLRNLIGLFLRVAFSAFFSLFHDVLDSRTNGSQSGFNHSRCNYAARLKCRDTDIEHIVYVIPVSSDKFIDILLYPV